jgi:UDP-4-amino-4-deoxy-L-arabinose formyltransferase/UDP-glucuronic acid dehydrogenase (UDP-4-keto-hexauronic acid decarboxylating)
MLLDSVAACARAGHEPVLIGTSQAAAEYTVDERDFEHAAADLGCPFFCDTAINRADIVALAVEANADVAISVNWLTVMGPEIRAAFTHGVVNAHAGDLPRYRGNACPNWAILMGEGFVGLTLHLMSDEVDAGPMLLKRRFSLDSTTYIADVYQFMHAAVPEMFVEALDGLEAGDLQPQPQPDDPSQVLRCYSRTPSDGLIDWGKSAEDVARLVRASAEPFPGAFTHLDGARAVIWRARPEPLAVPSLGVPGQVIEIRPDTAEVCVLTGDGQLVIESLELDGRPRAAAAEQVRSTRLRFGPELGPT